jgi:hypothetical protein
MQLADDLAKLALTAVLIIVVLSLTALVIETEDSDLATGVASVAGGALTIIGTIMGLFGGHRLGSAGRDKAERDRNEAEANHERERKMRMQEALRRYALEQELQDAASREHALAQADEIAKRLGLTDT